MERIEQFKYLHQQIFSFVLLQCLLLALYLILLSVLYLNQLGNGLFCLCVFANLFFIRSVLFAPICGYKYYNQIINQYILQTTPIYSIDHSNIYLLTSTSPSQHLYSQRVIIIIPMNCLELQRLYRQNQKLKAKLNEQNTSLDCLNSNVDTHAQIIAKQKNQITDLKQQIKMIKRKMEEEAMEKERVQNRYILVLQGLEDQLEQYKKKYLKLQNKIVPLMDHDSVRLKILNEVQNNHHLQINNLKTNIDTLKDQNLKLRRQNQILKHSLQNQRMNHQQQMRRNKVNKSNDFAQDTINYLTFSMWKDMEGKLKNSYEQARKQAEFYKQKYFAAQKKYQNRLLSPDRQDNQHQRSPIFK